MSSGGKQGGKNQKPNQRGGGAPVISDPRFAKMHTNREFMKLPKQQQKKQVDDRFKAMLTDKKFKTVAKLDQYGRKREAKDMDMSEFYRLENEAAEEKKKQQQEDMSGSDSESEEQSDEMDVDTNAPAVAKSEEESDEAEESDESDAESDESDDSEDSDEDDSEDESSDSLVDEVERDKQNIPIGDQSKRLAIVNCDWDRIKAQDVYLAFASFVPSTGVVKAVTVYLSDFGKQQIEEENTHGPRVFRKSSAESKQSADEDEESSDSDSGPLKGADEEDDDAIDDRRLRKYEKNKMRYYFGVAEFDSVASAAAVYKALDGFEIEKTSNRFDLRFVPDDVSFEGREVRDKCDAPPSEYKPPKYSTKALEHTTAKLTWDETPPERVAVMTGRLSKEQLREMDYQAFLASDSSDADSDDDEAVLAKLKAKNNPEGEKIKQNKRAKYAALLSAIETPEEDTNYGEKEEKEGEMEITFSADMDAEKRLQELVQRKKEGKEQTVFDKQMEKERERRQKKKEAAKIKKAQFAKGSASGDSEEAPEPSGGDKADGNKDIWADFDKGFEDPAAAEKKKKRKRGKKKGKKGADSGEEELDEATAQSRRELELLVAGDAKDDESSEEETKKDHERRQRAIVQDDRFGALLTDARFNPDPTNPLAKRLKGADVIVRERQKRVAERAHDESSASNKKAAPTNRAVADLINVVKKNVTQTKPDIPKRPEQSNNKPKDQKKTKSADGAPNAKRRKLE
eukprot:TRINITY_DN15389_c0_g1_i1.p1 TRINITY_DN15389_c0_g1~~TRINITY_DN15389_c0_g1_i1.p1  ORF type:complete len:741 (+),score=276.38 TRINITY_DN15389_c0_g1_i1:146-2368(+)